MVQFNLLPDVKRQYLKAQRLQRLITLISITAGAVAVAILLFSLATVDVVQKKSLHDVNADVTKYSQQLVSEPNINKVLTVQNQLNTVGSLHEQKVVASRLFSDIGDLTPQQASISNLAVDFTANTISITGEAPSLDVVNTYADTLKQATYTTTGSSSSTAAFSAVVLASFAVSDKGANYTITANFDPTLFSGDQNVTLSIPTGTATNPANLFEKAKT